MKEMTIHGVPYGLMTDGWWLVEEQDDWQAPPVPAPRASKARRIAGDLLLAAALTALLILLPDLASIGASGVAPEAPDLDFRAPSLSR